MTSSKIPRVAPNSMKANATIQSSRYLRPLKRLITLSINASRVPVLSSTANAPPAKNSTMMITIMVIPASLPSTWMGARNHCQTG